MDCLNNLVGIWDGCSAKEDKLYINDLPGFDLSVPEWLQKEQDASPLSLLENIRNKSGILLKHEILASLNPRVLMSSVLWNGTAGIADLNRNTKALEASKYKGVQISTETYPYTEIYIDTIAFFPVSNVTDLEIYVYDLTQGLLLDTFTQSVVGGQINYVQVGKTYKNKGQFLNLAVLVDSSLTDVYDVNPTGDGCRTCNTGLKAIGSYSSGRGVSILQISPIINSNLKGESHTNGLSLQYSVSCDHDYFVCSIANRFMLPMYYRFGIELMDEVLNSDRLNSYTTIGLEKARVMKDDLILKYNDTIKAIMQNLHIPNNACFYCTPNVTINTRIP
jgi:hypothetical protein